MRLTLRIDNLDSLADGGPLTYASDGRTFEVGRDTSLDWSLPDPNRFVSSRHMEFRFEQGVWFLNDVSTNGTFVNGASMRVKSPYRLEQGDRLQVGHYVIVVEMSGGPSADAAPRQAGGFAPPPQSPFGEPAQAPPAPVFMPQPQPAPAYAPPPPQQFAPAFAPVPAAGAFGGGGSPFQPGPGDSGPAPDDFSGIGMPTSNPRPAPSSADIWSMGGPAAAAPPPSYSPMPQAPMRQADFGSQHIPMPTPVAAPEVAASPFGPMPTTGGARPAQSEPFQPGRMSPPPAAPAPGPVVQMDPASFEGAFLRAICEGAGIRPDALLTGDPVQMGREIGRSLRIVAEDLAGLLKARAATKQSVKSGSRTMIGSTDNNPLKFIPTPEEALEVMFGAARPGFQRGAAAIKDALTDIKRHQYGVHAAIQPALAQLLEDISPEAIESKIGSSLLGSKKAKAWELFVERWDAMTTPYENGMLDVFLKYFSDAYDAASKKS